MKTKQKAIFVFVIIFALFGCKDNDNNIPFKPVEKDKGDYSLQAKYQSIRSYPTGGGIFIVDIAPEKDFTGTVNLKLEADPSLNAALSKTSLTKNSQVAEIIISPKNNAEIKNYNIQVVSTHAGIEKRIQLEVVMYHWEQGEIETPLSKLKEFKEWLVSYNKQYVAVFNNNDVFYHTYPQILIVEHYTFLTDEYEIRLCYHVMIPPYDWSMIMIRKRNSKEAEIAVRRETDGKIFEIPVADYPIQQGY